MAPEKGGGASHVYVSARAIGALLGALGKLELPVDPLLDFAELDRALLEDPDNRIPYEKLLRLWVAAGRESGDEFVGLRAAMQVRAEDYELLGYLIRTCPSVAELLAGFTRYQRLLADAIEIRPHFEGMAIRVVYEVPLGYQLPRPVAEYVMGVLMVLLRAALDEDIAPLEVCFAHPEPASLALYDEMFRCPLRFATTGQSVLLELDLEREMRRSDSDLHRILRRHADQLVESAGGDDFVARVSRLVEQRLLSGGTYGEEGLIDTDEVAKALAVSPRSLRRQLGERGVNLKSMVDSLRREAAMHYLASSKMSVGEIGFLVGFSEPSAFHRAFKRWTDQTPAAFRAGVG